MNNFKELGQFGKIFNVIQYKKVYKVDDLPKNGKKEIVFIGKSNVGKSSLINTLLNYNINKTSKNPGCTKWIGFLELPNINLIDLPGYGYSKVSKTRKALWDEMISEYKLTNRFDLVLILVDSRKGVSESDQLVANFFLKEKTKIIFTKKDKCKDNLSFSVSTKNGTGIKELREFISSFF